MRTPMPTSFAHLSTFLCKSKFVLELSSFRSFRLNFCLQTLTFGAQPELASLATRPPRPAPAPFLILLLRDKSPSLSRSLSDYTFICNPPRRACHLLKTARCLEQTRG